MVFRCGFWLGSALGLGLLLSPDLIAIGLSLGLPLQQLLLSLGLGVCLGLRRAAGRVSNKAQASGVQ
jgi:hypothetical protein